VLHHRAIWSASTTVDSGGDHQRRYGRGDLRERLWIACSVRVSEARTWLVEGQDARA